MNSVITISSEQNSPWYVRKHSPAIFHFYKIHNKKTAKHSEKISQTDLSTGLQSKSMSQNRFLEIGRELE